MDHLFDEAQSGHASFDHGYFKEFLDGRKFQEENPTAAPGKPVTTPKKKANTEALPSKAHAGPGN